MALPRTRCLRYLADASVIRPLIVRADHALIPRIGRLPATWPRFGSGITYRVLKSGRHRRSVTAPPVSGPGLLLLLPMIGLSSFPHSAFCEYGAAGACGTTCSVSLALAEYHPNLVDIALAA